MKMLMREMEIVFLQNKLFFSKSCQKLNFDKNWLSFFATLSNPQIRFVHPSINLYCERTLAHDVTQKRTHAADPHSSLSR